MLKKIFGLLLTILGVLLLIVLTSPIWIWFLVAILYVLAYALIFIVVVGILAIPIMLVVFGLKCLGK